jgi:hypothetical protein
MTAAPAAVARDTRPSVAAVRSFIGRHSRRTWVDWYVVGFGVLIAAIYGANFLAGPLSRLTRSASHAAATHAAATQAVAGAGLVIGAGAGLLLLAQALGPLALSPADASWLLLSPLDRRAILRRPALVAAVAATLAGALLGVLALAMAGPYLRLTGTGVPGTWLLLSAVAGAGCCLAAVTAEALAQPWQRPRSAIRAACGALAVIAAAGALAGMKWTSVTRAVTAVFGGLSTPDFAAAAVAAAVVAAVACVLLWRALATFPADVLRIDSARSGRALLAAQFLNFSILFRIAEDNYWRVRLIHSKPWPRLPPAMVLAWADWRRLARRPGPLAVLAVGAVVPALIGAAITGRARLDLIAAAIVGGALAAGLQGTTGAERDLDNPALRRLLGVRKREALAARAVLPALLSACWLALALALLGAVGVLNGWLWPLLGVVAGPGAAAAALRLARTAPINPADRGPDLPMGNTPPWAIARILSVLLCLLGIGPLLATLIKGQVLASSIPDQFVFSAIVLGAYLLLAGKNI